MMLAKLDAPVLAMQGLRVAAEKGKAETPERSVFYDCVFNNIREENLRDMMIPVYKKYYTKENALEMVAMLSTPLGKKFKASMHGSVNLAKAPVDFTPEENIEFSKYAHLFQSADIVKLNQELKQQGKLFGIEKARPCVKYIKAS